MSALARYFHAQKSKITGSDKTENDLIKDLELELNIKIWTPHNKKNITEINPDYIVYSTAITSENEELIWAKENSKVMLHRADLLEIATEEKKLIAVSGTHGKTTTSAMICEMLLSNSMDPSAIIGGILISKNTNTIIGKGDYFVSEADESDKSFLKGNPEISIITNIEADHLENFKDGLNEIKSSFVEFAKKALLKKGLIVCIQDKITNEIISNNFDINNPKILTYGIYPECKNTKISGKFNTKTKSWDVYFNNECKTSISLKIPGQHNILNALAAFSAGYLLGLTPENIKKSLENYKGVKRRFQILGTLADDITIVDDYAHHPTEIAATMKAAKELNPKRLIAIIQPHQPTRLKDLWEEFKTVLKEAENPVYITDIYVARGSQIEGITSKKLVSEISKPNINYLPGNINEIAEHLKKTIKSGDLILIMGAGDITYLGQKLLESNEILARNSGNN